MQGTMPGARRPGRPRTAWMDNVKDIDRTLRGRVNQNDRDRDKLRNHVHGVANPWIETAKEQSRTVFLGVCLCRKSALTTSQTMSLIFALCHCLSEIKSVELSRVESWVYRPKCF